MCVFLSVTPCALPQNRGIKTIQNAIVVVLKGSRPIATGIEKNRDPEIKGKTKKKKKKSEKEKKRKGKGRSVVFSVEFVDFCSQFVCMAQPPGDS